ncbi:hypothetical protein VKS41_002478 [Umbelopsis sp. WA50703]
MNESTAKSQRRAQIEQALKVLDEEGDARIQQLQKRIDLACLSIAGHGALQINQMISLIRDMTMREFCGKYGADVNKWLADYVRLQTQEARNYETVRRNRSQHRNPTRNH